MPISNSQLESVIAHTVMRENPSADEMHPLKSPVEFAPVLDVHEAIALFEERVASIVESDYGDFMRRSQTYFLEFLEELGPHRDLVKARLNWIEEYLQFRPNWDIDSTRNRLLCDIEQIKLELTHN
ncbi:MAG: hypothetical protein V4692_10015 [Bdellovibrionota bacterium]